MQQDTRRGARTQRSRRGRSRRRRTQRSPATQRHGHGMGRRGTWWRNAQGRGRSHDGESDLARLVGLHRAPARWNRDGMDTQRRPGARERPFRSRLDRTAWRQARGAARRDRSGMGWRTAEVRQGAEPRPRRHHRQLLYRGAALGRRRRRVGLQRLRLPREPRIQNDPRIRAGGGHFHEDEIIGLRAEVASGEARPGFGRFVHERNRSPAA